MKITIILPTGFCIDVEHDSAPLHEILRKGYDLLSKEIDYPFNFINVDINTFKVVKL